MSTRVLSPDASPAASQQVLGTVALLGVAVVLALFLVCMRRLGREIDPAQQLVVRNAIALSLVACVLASRRFDLRPKRPSRRVLWVIFWFCIVFPVSTLLSSYAAQRTDVGTVAFSGLCSSLLVGLSIDRLSLKEWPDRWLLAAAVVALTGAWVFAYPALGAQLRTTGFIVGALAGVALAISLAIRKLMAQAEIHPLLVVVLQTGAGVTIGLFLMLRSGGGFGPIFGLSAVAGAVAVVYGILTIVVVALVMYGMRHVRVGMGAIIVSTEVVFSVLLGYVFFGEPLTPTRLLGGVLLIGATALPHVPAMRDAARRPGRYSGRRAPAARA